MKRLLLIICAAAVCICADARREKKLVIVHFNDTHSHFEPIRSGPQKGLGGVIERAAYVDSVRAAEGKRHTLLMHAGDFSQGSPYFTILGGELEVDTINDFGYDIITLGNHEFDNGLDALAGRLKRLKCPVVCSNYDFTGHELASIVKPWAIVKKSGLKIGVFGLLPDLSSVVDSKVSATMKKLDDIEVSNRWADYLKNTLGCDLVIALTHIGYEGEEFTDPELVASSRNIDLVVGGHSHTFLDSVKYAQNLDGKAIPIVTDGCWGLYAGHLEIKGL